MGICGLLWTSNLQKWNQNISMACVLSPSTIKTRNHLFLSCQFSAQVWSSLMRGLLRDVQLILECHHDTHQRSHLLPGQTLHYPLCFPSNCPQHLAWKELSSSWGFVPSPPIRIVNHLDKTIRNRLSTIRLCGNRAYEQGLLPSGLVWL